MKASIHLKMNNLWLALSRRHASCSMLIDICMQVLAFRRRAGMRIIEQQNYTMKSLLKTILVAGALASSGSLFAISSETITFDDLPSSGTSVPNGYAGMNWNNFGYINGPTEGFGYANGTVSSPNVGYNEFGTPASFMSASTPFDLTSAYITGAWNDGLNVEVIGFNGVTTEYDNTYTVNTSGPSHITFNYDDITSVEFVSSGGTENPNYVSGGHGTQFAIDNIAINGGSPGGGGSSVPDGGTTTMMLGGALAGLGFLRKKLS
jgi:VPDSG-CTERM motif